MNENKTNINWLRTFSQDQVKIEVILWFLIHVKIYLS